MGAGGKQIEAGVIFTLVSSQSKKECATPKISVLAFLGALATKKAISPVLYTQS